MPEAFEVTATTDLNMERAKDSMCCISPITVDLLGRVSSALLHDRGCKSPAFLLHPRVILLQF